MARSSAASSGGRRRASAWSTKPGMAPPTATLEADRRDDRELVGPVAVVGVDRDGAAPACSAMANISSARERRVEGDRPHAGLLVGELPHEDVDVVGQGVGDDVAGADAPSSRRRVHQLVGPPGELAVGQRSPDGLSTTAGRSGWSSAMYQMPSRCSQGWERRESQMERVPSICVVHQTSSRFSTDRSPGG